MKDSNTFEATQPVFPSFAAGIVLLGLSLVSAWFMLSPDARASTGGRRSTRSSSLSSHEPLGALGGDQGLERADP